MPGQVGAATCMRGSVPPGEALPLVRIREELGPALHSEGQVRRLEKTSSCLSFLSWELGVRSSLLKPQVTS